MHQNSQSKLDLIALPHPGRSWGVRSLGFAMVLFLSACVTGPDIAARYARAVDLYDRGQPSLALSEFQKLAAINHPGAQYHLGRMYETGVGGLPQNIARSAQLMAKAAEQGNAAAQDTLGHLHLFGTGVAKDELKAAYWLKLAAKRDRPSAQWALAKLYSRGNRVEQNLVEAYKWYSLAARRYHGDDLEAILHERRILKQFMTAKELAKAQARIHTWRPVIEN